MKGGRTVFVLRGNREGGGFVVHALVQSGDRSVYDIIIF